MLSMESSNAELWKVYFVSANVKGNLACQVNRGGQSAGRWQDPSRTASSFRIVIGQELSKLTKSQNRSRPSSSSPSLWPQPQL